MTLFKIFFLRKWLFQFVLKISVISEHQAKPVYLFSFAIVFLVHVDILHRSFRHLIAWLDCSRMAIWIDMIETDPKGFCKNGKTRKNICCFLGELIHSSSSSALLLFPWYRDDYVGLVTALVCTELIARIVDLNTSPKICDVLVFPEVVFLTYKLINQEKLVFFN